MGYFLSFLIIFLPTLVYSSPAEEPEEYNIPILDSTQELLGLNVGRVANRLDMFFAEQRADDELARSRIRIRRRYEVREDATMKTDTQIRFNIRLPALEKKFRIKYNSSKEAKADENEGNEKPALASPVIEENPWQFRADVGANASIPPTIFTRGRLRKNWETWQVIHRFVQELGWYSDRDWEAESTFDSDLPINENLLLRYRNTAFWRITRKTFETAHGPALIQKMSEHDAISYGANFATTIIDRTWYVSNYRLSTTYRRNLYKQWLYFDITPGLDFPKGTSFRRSPFISFQLEALFGDK